MGQIIEFDKKYIKIEDREPPPGGMGGGGDMEARIAKLEADVENIKTNVADIKTDIRELRKETVANFNGIRNDAKWVILIFIGLFSAVFATMAKGFNWF